MSVSRELTEPCSLVEGTHAHTNLDVVFMFLDFFGRIENRLVYPKFDSFVVYMLDSQITAILPLALEDLRRVTRQGVGEGRGRKEKLSARKPMISPYPLVTHGMKTRLVPNP